jgi:actin, other eukaryote
MSGIGKNLYYGGWGFCYNLRFVHPKDVKINNLDYYNGLIQYTLYNEMVKMGSPTFFKILFSENSFIDSKSREILTEMMFENYDIPSLFFAKQEVLGLFGCGRYNGLIINSGEILTTSIPILDGFPVKKNSLKTNVAGKEITSYLTKLLCKNGLNFGKNSTHREKIITNIKENLCFVSKNYENDLKNCENNLNNVKKYELPDNSIIKINEEIFKSTEILFKPNLISCNTPVHEICFNSIEKFDKDLQKFFYSNI